VSRADDRRADLTGKLADFLLAEGIEAASLRPLAQAAGLSDRMLLYYFHDKAEVLSAALDELAARLLGLLAAPAPPLPEAALWDRLSSQARDPTLWPYLCLWLEVAARAGRGDAFWIDRGRALGQGFHDWIAAQLDAPEDRRAQVALALFQRLEGLVLLRAVGLDQAPRDQR
jgi:AcrR family transcriptional regulator